MEEMYEMGYFVREEKNRFICTVDVRGENIECYIPSSCKLGNFLKLAGKEVILRKNLATVARTKYAVFAVKYKYNYIVLNTSEANKAIFDSLGRRLFAYMGKRSNPQKEIVVDGYKTDIYLPGEDTIIEVKSIISLDEQAIFPTVYSERAINQLKKIRELLQGGKKVTYLFVSLNPYVESFAISNEKQMDAFRDLFLDCLESGMECKGYTTCLNNYEIQIKKEIPFIISNS